MTDITPAVRDDLAFLRRVAGETKASGLAVQAVRRLGARGVSVAPPAA